MELPEKTRTGPAYPNAERPMVAEACPGAVFDPLGEVGNRSEAELEETPKKARAPHQEKTQALVYQERRHQLPKEIHGQKQAPETTQELTTSRCTAQCWKPRFGTANAEFINSVTVSAAKKTP